MSQPHRPRGLHETTQLNLTVDIFETHKLIIIRIAIHEESLIRNLKVYIGNSELLIERLPQKWSQLIPLPVLIYTSQASCLYQEQILEIQLTKASMIDYYKEIPIEFGSK
jgi:hypothetical protein